MLSFKSSAFWIIDLDIGKNISIGLLSMQLIYIIPGDFDLNQK